MKKNWGHEKEKVKRRHPREECLCLCLFELILAKEFKTLGHTKSVPRTRKNFIQEGKH
jgi:hypothetical protein